MTVSSTQVETIVRAIQTAPRKNARRVIAVAGPPASGKSTISAEVSARLCDMNIAAQVIPMDGFHLDNAILDQRGLRARKGAPETFDVSGFLSLVKRLGSGEEVIYPLFDRARDIAIAGAGATASDCDTLIVEGNYLLIDAPVWRDLAPFFDLRIYIDTPEAILRERLVRRWKDHGLDHEAAVARSEGNDLRNAKVIKELTRDADIRL